MKIVTVIPLEKTAFSGILTYFTSKELSPGSIVSIAIRNKKILGLAVSVEEAEDMKSDIKGMDFNLRKILDVKEHSLFRGEFLDAAFMTSEYFGSTKNSGLSLLIPTILKTEYDKISKFVPATTISSQHSEIRPEKLLLQMPFEERISVYKTLIRENFAVKKSIFIVLPTEQDIKEISGILSKGIEQFTYALYSNLSEKKTLHAIQGIITNAHPILILGTAPFLSVPRYDIGTIILEHESSNAYRNIGRPHMDQRVFAEIFASKINAKIIFSDTMLRFETIGREEIDNFAPMHPMSYRIDLAREIQILDKGDKFKVLSDEVIREITTTLEKGENAFVFALRKGLATMTVCRDCSHVVDCENCGGPVVLYLSRDGKKRMFICNRCKNQMKDDTYCKSCGSWNLMPLGIGTDTVELALREIFPKIKLFKIDKEAVKSSKGAEKIVEEFESEKGAILIGTEMALYYIHKQIPLSIISSFETLWGIPNFKMSEKVIQLILALHSKSSKKLIVQTKNPTDPVIQAVQSGNLVSFVRSELEDRKNLDYPPYKRFIKITHTGEKSDSVNAKEALLEVFSPYQPEIFGGFIGSSKNKYVTNMLIKIEPSKWSLPELSTGGTLDKNLLLKLLSLPSVFDIYIDPEDLL